MSWASEELAAVDLGDKRRNRRLVRIVEDLSSHPSSSVPQAIRDPAALQGLYDFWANPRIKARDILAGHQHSVIARSREQKTVLAIQDTSEVDYSAHRKSTRGIGSLSNPEARGLKLHTVLATSDSGVPLGILHQQMWSRTPKRGVTKERRQRLIEDKESVRWRDSLEISQSLIPPEVQVITIADREADIYELFAHPRRPGSELLIRAAQNRNTKRGAESEEMEPLNQAIGRAPICGRIELNLQRTPRRKARRTELSIRYTHLWLQAPAHLEITEPIEIWVILAEEETPPANESAVRWLLLSTQPVTDLAEACESLRRYSQRWEIERYFYALKTGCRVEELQLESGERIERAIATYSIVAWRLMWLMHTARQQPDLPISDHLETVEWQALYLLYHRSSTLPATVPRLGESLRWIAKLGGFIGRKSDGDPGIQTVWRGWMELAPAAVMWETLQQQQQQQQQDTTSSLQ